MNILFSIPLDTGLFVEVDAELLPDLAPHLADVATFAVHLTPNRLDHWSVTNLETGLHITKDSSKAMAIKRAQMLLSYQTHEKVERAYRNAAKIHGLDETFSYYTR